MPTSSHTKLGYGVKYWVTYSAIPKPTPALIQQINRSRRWDHSDYKTPSSRAKRLLEVGYLTTLSYTDDLQHVVNSKQMYVTGKLSSSANAKFAWAFVPSVPRTAVSTTDGTMNLLANRALGNLQSKISGHGTNVYVTLGEAEKTVNMVTQAVKALYTSYRHVRHGNFLAAAKALGLNQVPKRVGKYRTPADNWMEYRYGWRLVVKDVESSMNTLYDLLTTRPIVMRVETKTEQVNDSTAAQPGMTMGPSSSFPAVVKFTQNTSVKYTREVRSGYVYQLESVPLAGAQSLGLLNLATVAWDLLPGSFLVDWSLNVGQCLEGLTAFQGKQYLDGWECRIIQSETTVYWTNVVKGYSVYSLDGVVTFYSPTVVERRFQRTRISGFTSPSLRLDFDFGTKRALDALSILSQVLGGKKISNRYSA